MRTKKVTDLVELRHRRVGARLAVVLACLLAWTWPQLAHAQPFTITQITNTIGTVDRVRGLGNSATSINATGTRIAFVSDRDLAPGNPGNADGNREIFLFDTTTSTFTQVTNTTSVGFGGGNFAPSINAVGTRIAFVSTTILLFDTTSGIFNLIPDTPFPVGGTGAPSINADGTRIAFAFRGDLTPGSPGNEDFNFEIFLFDITTGSFTQITNTTGEVGVLSNSNSAPAINAAGTRIVFVSNRNLTGGNADGNRQIFLFDTTTSTFTQVTNTTGGITVFANVDPRINAAGTRVAFHSDRNLTGGNADSNLEIFLFDTTTGTFTQITNTIEGFNSDPEISADGTRIVFLSDRDLVPGGNADSNLEIFLFDTTTGTFTQITNTIGGGNSSPSINATGTRIAFESDRDLTPGSPGNADGNSEIFLASSVAGPVSTIPTLAEWGMILLGLLLAGGMAAALRRPPLTLILSPIRGEEFPFRSPLPEGEVRSFVVPSGSPRRLLRMTGISSDWRGLDSAAG